LLEFLGDFLQTFPDPDGILVIVNEQGQILGDRRQSLKGGTEIQSITTLLPSSGPSWQTLSDSRGESLGSDRVFVAGIDNPKWRVLYLLPESIITQRVLKDYSAQLALAA
jgi:hypothetical protein